MQMTHSYTCCLHPIVRIIYPAQQLRNKLKLNQDKTELLVISSKYRPRPPLDYIRVGEEVIKSSKQARNLGVGFDQYLDFKEHVKLTCKSAFFRIRSIAKIR